MAFSNEVKENISLEVIRTLVNQFDKFPEDASNNRNAPFHEAFLNAFKDKIGEKISDVPFLLTLKNWLHGLETSLGQSFFEKTAHILSKGEKREYTSKKLGNLTITATQKKQIGNIITSLSTGEESPSQPNEKAKLLVVEDDSEAVGAIDFSADIFIEDQDKIIAIELKSVRPNSGEMRGEKQKILEGKTALFNKFRKDVEFYIGFPFDPTSEEDTSFNKERFLGSIINMTKFFDPQETLIASELWDFLSGEKKTMEGVLGIINTIATTEFLNKFQFINDKANIVKGEYREILEAWNLSTELRVIDNWNRINEAAADNKELQRILNHTPFKNKGAYNSERSSKLLECI